MSLRECSVRAAFESSRRLLSSASACKNRMTSMTSDPRKMSEEEEDIVAVVG